MSDAGSDLRDIVEIDRRILGPALDQGCADLVTGDIFVAGPIAGSKPVYVPETSAVTWLATGPFAT